MESEKIHQCPTCQKVLASKSNLKRHINTVHKKESSLLKLADKDAPLEANQQTLDNWLIKTQRSKAGSLKKQLKSDNIREKQAKPALFNTVATQTYASPMVNKDIDTGKFTFFQR